MRLSYILVGMVVIVVILGFRWLVGRYFTLEGRTLGAEQALSKAGNRYDDAAEAFAAFLGVHLQPGDPVNQMLLEACNKWDATVGADLQPDDPVRQKLREASSRCSDAQVVLTEAWIRFQTLTGPDPYGRHVANGPGQLTTKEFHRGL